MLLWIKKSGFYCSGHMAVMLRFVISPLITGHLCAEILVLFPSSLFPVLLMASMLKAWCFLGSSAQNCRLLHGTTHGEHGSGAPVPALGMFHISSVNIVLLLQFHMLSVFCSWMDQCSTDSLFPWFLCSTLFGDPLYQTFITVESMLNFSTFYSYEIHMVFQWYILLLYDSI